MLEQSLEQLKASLEAEKRSSAANHRRLVAENAGLIKQLREAQRDSAGAAPSRMRRAERARQPQPLHQQHLL